MKITTVKINVTRILKEHLYEGKSGKYLDIALLENRNGPDQFGNDGYVTQSISKEARQRGEKGPIIGNWKVIDNGAPKTPAPAATAPVASTETDDDVPF